MYLCTFVLLVLVLVLVFLFSVFCFLFPVSFFSLAFTFLQIFLCSCFLFSFFNFQLSNFSVFHFSFSMFFSFVFLLLSYFSFFLFDKFSNFVLFFWFSLFLCFFSSSCFSFQSNLEKSSRSSNSTKTFFFCESGFLGLGGQGVRIGPCEGEQKKNISFFYFEYVSLLTLISEFNYQCFLRSRCSMEVWCPDDTGRDSWDWVGSPARGRACINSPE